MRASVLVVLAAAQSLLPPVGALPELETSVLTDFFGGGGDYVVPDDAVEMATSEAVARVGVDFGLLNQRLAEERTAVEKQVNTLEEKVIALMPKVESVTNAEVWNKIEGEQ